MLLALSDAPLTLVPAFWRDVVDLRDGGGRSGHGENATGVSGALRPLECRAGDGLAAAPVERLWTAMRLGRQQLLLPEKVPSADDELFAEVTDGLFAVHRFPSDCPRSTRAHLSICNLCGAKKRRAGAGLGDRLKTGRG
ncbi:MAG: hypothetical protein OWT28_00230 [Firmicutes bacterium]|nr:hypothetical protein [Bacillota bacterium]